MQDSMFELTALSPSACHAKGPFMVETVTARWDRGAWSTLDLVLYLS